jgi:hypothetical protein
VGVKSQASLHVHTYRPQFSVSYDDSSAQKNEVRNTDESGDTKSSQSRFLSEKFVL